MPKRYFQDRIIAFKDGDQYVAVSLEFDLVAEGNTIMQTLTRLFDATVGYLKICVEDSEPGKAIYRPAPKKYQVMFEQSQLLAKVLSKKSEKGTLKTKEKNLINKEAQTILKSYDARKLINA